MENSASCLAAPPREPTQAPRGHTIFQPAENAQRMSGVPTSSTDLPSLLPFDTFLVWTEQPQAPPQGRELGGLHPVARLSSCGSTASLTSSTSSIPSPSSASSLSTSTSSSSLHSKDFSSSTSALAVASQPKPSHGSSGGSSGGSGSSYDGLTDLAPPTPTGARSRSSSSSGNGSSSPAAAAGATAAPRTSAAPAAAAAVMPSTAAVAVPRVTTTAAAAAVKGVTPAAPLSRAAPSPSPAPSPAPSAVAAAEAAAVAGAPALVVPLQPPVFGLTQLHVRLVQLSAVTAAHVAWLRAGWEAHTAAPAAATASSSSASAAGGQHSALPLQQQQQQQGTKKAKQQGKRKAVREGSGSTGAATAPIVRVVGFDTEFVGDQLALVQLCCGDRALLVRVPPLRPAGGGGSGSSSKSGAPKSSKGSKSSVGKESGSSAEGITHPFECPEEMKALLCDPSLPKAAAEAWQDALMLFAAFGVRLRNGLDLTLAFPPNEEEQKRGRKKLSLFAIFQTLFPDSTLAKDKTIDHTKWFATALSGKQVQYAALDAFVSYAAGVEALRRSCGAGGRSGGGGRPTRVALPSPVDLALREPWEVALAAQWVAVSQFLEADAGVQVRSQSDFCHASFEERGKNKGLVLEVRMSRFKTRLRRNCWAEVNLLDGRRLHGRCVNVSGKTAHIGKLKWSAGTPGAAGRDVRADEVSSVSRIEMEEVGDTMEEEAVKELISKMLRGEQSLRDCPLAAAIFGSGSTCNSGNSKNNNNSNSGSGSSSSVAAVSTAAAGAAAALSSKARGKGKTHGSSAASLAPAPALPSLAQPALGCELRQQVQTHLRGLDKVNVSQQAAIQEILLGESPVQLIQGPPGTGKTTVISHTVNLWLQHMAALRSSGSTAIAVPSNSARHGNGAGSSSSSGRKGKGSTNSSGSGSSSSGPEALACVARSNVAARNIALSLLKRGLGPQQFRLVVSHEFHFEWHEEQYYGPLQDVLITSDELSDAQLQRRLEGVQVFVTTVSMLANRKFRSAALTGKRLTRLLVDEASQIYAGDLMLPLAQYGRHLRRLSLFGDDQQLPPFGSDWDGPQVPSMFDHLAPAAAITTTTTTTTTAAITTVSGSSAVVPVSQRPRPNAVFIGPRLPPPPLSSSPSALLSGSSGRSGTGGGGVSTAVSRRLLLSVSYRLPPPLCGFISREMYGNALQSGTVLRWPVAVRWVDVRGSEERCGGLSCCNPAEAAAVCGLVARELQETSWTVLTGYDLQRSVLEKEINKRQLRRLGDTPAAAAGGISGSGSSTRKAKGSAKGGDTVAGSDRVYNIDTFQGREDDIVIASLVRCGSSLGFMQDDRRVNVMLTRCTQLLVVVGSLDLALRHPASLIGRMAAHCVAEGRVERHTQQQQQLKQK